jgi:tRNA(Arg) A34 adenosine deaminase TadA
MSDKQLEEIMQKVLAKVDETVQEGNNPFAAALIDKKGEIIEIAGNRQNTDNRIFHAEVNLIKKATDQLRQSTLEGYSVVSASEPCSMCMALLIKAKIDTVYFGAPIDKGNDPYIKAEELAKKAKHNIKVVGGILKKQCKAKIYEERKYDF